jgi:hypothetical protein
VPWWGTLIIAAVAAVAAVIITWILARRGGASVDRAAIAEAQRKTAEEIAATEQAAKKKIEGQRADLAARLKAINAWYREQSSSMRAEVKREYETLAGDPAALDRKLDQLLADD